LRYLYTILFYLALPFLFIRLLWRSFRIPGYRKNWRQRLGFCPHRFDECIWIHVVSVGETIAAQPLIKAVIQEYPNTPVLLTNMTPTGAERVKAMFATTAYQTFIPYDLPDANARFLKRVRPKVAVIFETELWPNLFAACRKRQIPILVMNARLSEKSAKGYRSILSVTQEMFRAITHIAAQAPQDAERFIQLGFPQEKMRVTGNIKFDLEIPQLDAKELRASLGTDRPVWIAASTHPGEEEIVFRAHQLIREQFPEALLILAARHPDRAPAIGTIAKNHGFSFVRRSLKEACLQNTHVYLADTLGELLLMYSASDVAFVGGSLVSVGGHNLMEPAVLGKPILSGPILFNFYQVSQLLLNGDALLIINNSAELAEKVLRCFSEAAFVKKLGENAVKVVMQNRGALQKQFDVIKMTLSS
jgi:3-deoxy-D-manno-octulosonic-acid transferase